MERKTKFRHYIEAVLIYALPWALRPLPFAWRVTIGGAVIGFALRHVPSLRRRIEDNVALVLPEMAAQKGFLQRISRHIGRGFMVLFYSKDYHEKLSGVEMAPEAFAEIKAAQAAGKPVIVVSGHFGEWEAIRVMLSRAGMPSASIYREAGNPIFERHFAKAMAVGGAGLFQTGLNGTRKMLKHLKAGGIITVLLDQRVNEGKVLDFMGKPALSSSIMATLAVKTGALMVPVYAPLNAQGKVQLIVEPAIVHGQPLAMIQAINDSLSTQVRAHPEQWYWLHKRWARPDL
ncbi:MAG: lysophospholipid acyltransferase family protein [Rhodobacteraceae bacterium]|nr:lysophospholipid acyltransferase family protein [Paracoccaceae bacterium]